MYFMSKVYKLLIFQLIIFQRVLSKNEERSTKILRVRDHVFHLSPSKRDVFKNVSIWTLDSKGLKYKGNSSKYDVICQDVKKGATFLPNTNCPYKGKCSGVCFFGVFGTTEKQNFLNLHHHIINRGKCKTNESENSYRESSFDHDRLTGKFSNNVDLGTFYKNKTYRVRKSLDLTLGVLYPKLLIFVDFTLFIKLKKNISLVEQYVNIFWNAVDQRYVEINEPQIKLKIVSLIIETEQNVLPFFANKAYGNKSQYLNMTQALRECMYLKQSDTMNLNEYGLNKHHAIVTLTSYDEFTGPIRRLGISTRGAICSDTYMCCSIIYDDGRFNGVRSAIHEVAHMLGLQHDGFNKKNEGKLYEACDPKYYKEKNFRTIMAPYNDRSDKQLVWSTCSKNVLHTLGR